MAVIFYRPPDDFDPMEFGCLLAMVFYGACACELVARLLGYGW